MARPKRYCVAPGCPVVVPAKDKAEYCSTHRCQAFSVSYGQCVQGRTHRNKHINHKNEEWG